MSRPESNISSVTAPRRRGGQAMLRAYEHVRQAILDGTLTPGSPLGEDGFARELDVSRTPIREALQRLVQEGLLEVGPRRQLFVRRLSRELRSEVFLLREALEPTAVAQAATVIDDDSVDRLHLLLRRQRRAADAEDVRQFIDLDEKFHLEILAGARLPLFAKFIIELRAFVRMMGIEAASYPGRTEEVLREHGAIVEALERRDGKRAQATMLAHLQATAHTLETRARADAKQSEQRE